MDDIVGARCRLQLESGECLDVLVVTWGRLWGAVEYHKLDDAIRQGIARMRSGTVIETEIYPSLADLRDELHIFEAVFEFARQAAAAEYRSTEWTARQRRRVREGRALYIVGVRPVTPR